MAITPDYDHRIGPFFSEAKDQLFQKRRNITLLTSPSWLEDRGDQLSRKTFINVQGHVTVIPIVMVVQVQLLLPIGIVVGIVAIQDDGFRFSIVGLHKDVHQFLAYAIQILAVNRVLQTAHRGLGGKSGAHLRSTVSTELEDHIITQIITVIAVFVACCYLKYPLDKHLFYGMVSISLIPTICNTVAYAINKP